MGKGKKKGGAVVADWENDVDDIEAEAKGEPGATAPPKQTESPAPTTPQTVDDLDAMWSDDDKKSKKKGKNKKKQNNEPAADAQDQDNNGADNKDDGEDGGGSTVKTKAQKAAEKKQREKANKKNKNQDNNTQETTETNTEATPEPTKGKKKGKKEEKKDEKKPKRKGPPTAALKEMLEAQRKAEEEEQRKEEELRAREEEALRLHKEKLAKEQEKKDKKKEKEKLRKERLKAEGKLLTDKQKKAKARAEMLLEARQNDAADDETEDIPAETVFVKTKVLSLNQKKKLKAEQQRKQQEEQEKEKEEAAAAQLAKEAEMKIKISEKIEKNKKEEKESSSDWDASTDEDNDDDEEDDESPDATPEVTANATTNGQAATSTQPKKKNQPAPITKHKETPMATAVAGSGDDSSDDDERYAGQDNFFDIDDVADRIQARRKYHSKHKASYFRAPVVCVLGHVDTGKTKTLDNLRRTNVQDNEAGGITQQIGATNVPLECIAQRTEMVETLAFSKIHKINIPGLLIIDTPGHESFANLRSRGSSLCDVAILVVDIMHGLENQTRESIKLLKKNKTPFVVALNKIDRLYQWQTNPDKDIKEVVKGQKRNTQNQFDDLYKTVINQMAMESLNIKLVWEFTGDEVWSDDDPWVPVCPTSAHSGDGMGNLMAQVIDLAQTACKKKITYTRDLKCTIMEVKAIEGLGKAVDAILVNGRLKTGDMIVFGGQNGPISTNIKQIYTPPVNKDLRVKNQWVKHSCVKGATGVKIVARDDMDKALAGLPLYVARREDEVEYFKDLLDREIQHALKAIKLHNEGVYVQASTLGSLEALLEYLRSSKVKYSAINIGPINKKDIMKASTMLEHNEKYGVVLGFDVPVTRDAQELADSFKPPIKIFTADIIYHLTDQFSQHLVEQKRRKQEELKHIAIFPCSMKIMPECIFAKRDPIIVGIKIIEGQLKVGAPICVPAKENLCIGNVASIEVNGQPQESAGKNEEVCIKIENTTGAPRLIGRHFDATDELVTRISRDGIDALKEWFRDEMTKEDWNLCVKLKKTFQIL